jgi:putative methyltransferase (TIGR04325 family)
MVGIGEWLPPAVKRTLIGMGLAGNRFDFGYDSWTEARAKCSGYDSDTITKSLVSASRRVRDGEIAYERDGVEFDVIQYSWPLLAAILGSPRSSQKLAVLDWGGSLGSTYRQNKYLLESAGIQLEWLVVEQRHLVEIGTSEFTSGALSFSESMSGITVGQYDVAILASSICYIQDPERVLSEIAVLQPKRIVFDRTPESRSGADQIGVQRVGKGIYKASYPIRAFAPDSLAKYLSPQYKLVFDWESDLQPDPKTISKGYCFDRI